MSATFDDVMSATFSMSWVQHIKNMINVFQYQESDMYIFLKLSLWYISVETSKDSP